MLELGKPRKRRHMRYERRPRRGRGRRRRRRFFSTPLHNLVCYCVWNSRFGEGFIGVNLREDKEQK